MRRRDKAQLDQDIDGWLKAAAKLLGKIEASRANEHASGPPTLNINVVINTNGRTIPIKTTCGFQPENKVKT